MNTAPKEMTPLTALPHQRPIHVFQVPVGLVTYGITSIGMVELTANEEIMATKRSNNNPMQLGYELAKESLRMVDKKKVSTVDGTADAVFNNMHPKVRTLLAQAYTEIHSPKDSDSKDFLSSREYTAG